ncbi:trimethylamine---corrinoid protein Co-methyltransferase [Methanococcoides vulcani]|uniref:Trimethylamine methyltransferase n=1 Tax=Methanococcoides vulcani TaxID=1353158 RepID=A0A1I0A8C4_9EURY|nr:trimethylamine methyltransferase family protein [Methanococcoides vulcani]SES90395.1 trimethylamine---corrinoid protein Co-methyltransferase [Methanococcoides vulcani]
MLNGLKGNMNGKLKYLSDEDCEEIHYSSLEVLDETGLKIESKKALDKLDEFGCDVNRRTSIVRFPSYLVEECLKYTPPSVKLYGTDSKYDIKIGKRRTYVSTCSGHGIIDRKTDLARDGLLNDVAEGTLVAENLENIHSIIPPLAGVSDVPHEAMTPVILGETLKNTHKSVDFYLTGGANADKDMKNILELCKIIAGSESKLEKRPFMMFIIDPLSPLTYTEDQIEALFRSVDAGLPVSIMPGAQGGATAPVTLAGMLVQTNAEFLGGVVLANLVKKGAPVLYGHTSTIMNMHTGVYTGGAIEMGILGACVSQLGAYYNVPTSGFYPMSDSHIPDQQVGYEKTMQWVLTALSGMNYVSGAGNIENGALISLEQLVIDNEIVGMIDRMLNGVQIDDQRLAVSVIGDIGPGGNYLKHAHTRNWMHNEYFTPNISEKDTYSEWEKKGGGDVVKRAREHVETILKNEVSPVEKDIIKDIEVFQNKLLRQK